MGDLKIKRVCGFNVSSIHFSVMILPYINKELENGKEIITFLEGNLEKNIQEILSKITLNNEAKEKIKNINWKATDIEKINFERFFKQKITEEKNLSFIVYGSEKYINNVNEKIEKTLKKHEKILENRNIKITNCYTIDDFKENIREILNKHEAMFNTSGEKKIEEIFTEFHSA